ncbi:uncharacterized protein BP01DRAFT_329356 [Aspergillus saccharolyticus JOP 1030-1]|uniref:Uncharacterized protein n=1 Tax=Aspergillus saccharolyticus JOP 1030-1 TaxID=1450539 RepID=A0A318Z7J6_9EURO|nr:hypothetical protein BP01DRAFT_329356 [Aspergillus saccharolyticus JOP 1030-1]PYH40723.1 hypothetical protein BP01DRAFT_329356 [Aspergillus saccharolyticus JOP 1030-1]
MAPLGETIAVIDRSGKVVSTSKHLFGVFSQAKNAYRERKAQVQSERNAKIAEREALKMLQNYHIDDGRYEAAPSVASSRRSRSRQYAGRSRSHHPGVGSLYEEDVHWRGDYEAEDPYYNQPREMVRRHTHHDVGVRELDRPVPVRTRSDYTPHVDMDLAYGEFHPSALEPPRQDQLVPPPHSGQLQRIEDPELNGLVSRAQWLLEEADCMQHTATATIAHLQKNPDSMAAVALTLAEISNLVTKLAPSALGALKAAAPSVFALLASPQFLIAAGVGLGVTIVMFGGYKIVKQIQSATSSTTPVLEAAPHQQQQQQPPPPFPQQYPRDAMDDPSMEDMMEFNTDCLSSVEMWRRGVADAEAESAGTSVDGEFITPTAAMMSGIDVTTARMTRDPRFKFDDDDEHSRASSRRSRRSRSHQHGRSRADHRPPESYLGSKAPPSSHHHPSSQSEARDSKKPKEKTKRSSRLRLMFTT